jgi:hydrogenase nickel incorporation protein HypA/HybF
MHELSIASAVVETAERHAGGRRVTAIELRIGHLRQVVGASLAFYFGHVASGTVCEGAQLTWQEVPARLGCNGCGHGWELDVPGFRCPDCGSADVTIEQGNELHVEWIEVEQEDHECIA